MTHSFFTILISSFKHRRPKLKHKLVVVKLKIRAFLLLKNNSSMGCVFSKGKVEEIEFRELPSHFSGIDKGGICRFDSCELKMTPVRVGTRKVQDKSSIIGRAGTAGIERAVEVLDTLGSSISNLTSNSGFISGFSTQGHKISILAFEVANTVAKGSNLLRSLSEENVATLKEDISKCEGIRQLVTDDYRELMTIAAVDKRDELEVFAAEVIRFGNLCKDPVWHNLGRYFQKLDSELTLQEKLKEEVETSMQQLLDMAEITSELYHEVNALDRFEQDYQRKLHEEVALPSTRRETLLILHSELKRQRKLVKGLKKRSLWSRNLEEVVEVLADVVVYLHTVILEAFDVKDTNLAERGMMDNQRLGVLGLALHYANIVSQIDNIVSRPLSLPPNTRNTLYQGLPPSVKSALRSKLQLSDVKQEYTAAQIKVEIQKTLKWMVPMAENTIRLHQGFGWVGEWANLCPEANKNPTKNHYITRIHTLYYADKEKIEKCILDLVVWLHHLVIHVRNKGHGFKFMSPTNNGAEKGKLQVENASTKSNKESVSKFKLSEEDKEMLQRVDSTKVVLGRSKSQEFVINKEQIRKNSEYASRSLGNSPMKGFNRALAMERTKILDKLDGLDIFH